MKQFSKKQSSHLSVVSPVSSSNCPRTLISTTPGYGSCSHQEHETRDKLVTISNLEIYCREHRRWWCVSATRARLTIWRCVLEDNEETRRMLCRCVGINTFVTRTAHLDTPLWHSPCGPSSRHQQVAHPAVTRPGQEAGCAEAKINELLNDRTLNFHRQQNLTARRSGLTNC